MTLIKRVLNLPARENSVTVTQSNESMNKDNDDVPNDDADILLANFAVSEIGYTDRKFKKCHTI